MFFWCGIDDMNIIYGKRKVGELLTTGDVLNTPFVNTFFTHQTVPASKHYPSCSFTHTMASSSKGKQTLEDHYASLSLQNDDDEDADLPFGEVDLEETESFMLVGTLITEKNVKFNFLKETLSTVWRPMKGMVAKEISTNLFIFYFFHVKDRRRVMDNNPWSFDQSLLVL